MGQEVIPTYDKSLSYLIKCGGPETNHQIIKKGLPTPKSVSIFRVTVLATSVLNLLSHNLPHPPPWILPIHIRSDQISHAVVSDSLPPHELQHARPPCPLPTPGVYPNSWPLSRWCYLTISSSVVPFSSCPQSFPNQGLFQWVNSANEVAKVLEFQLQHQSSQWTPRTDLL